VISGLEEVHGFDVGQMLSERSFTVAVFAIDGHDCVSDREGWLHGRGAPRLDFANDAAFQAVGVFFLRPGIATAKDKKSMRPSRKGKDWLENCRLRLPACTAESVSWSAGERKKDLVKNDADAHAARGSTRRAHHRSLFLLHGVHRIFGCRTVQGQAWQSPVQVGHCV
jgi:hypothetical protein